MGKGHDLTSADTVAAALSLLKEKVFDLLIADLSLPDGEGMEVVQHYKKKFPRGAIIVITGSLITVDRLAVIEALGVNEILFKPFGMEDLMKIVKKCLKNQAEITTP